MLTTLDGKARRQIMLLPLQDRDTGKKILDILTKKYGSNQSSDQLRADFFDCKQLVGEGIEDFILCLREFNPLTDGEAVTQIMWAP